MTSDSSQSPLVWREDGLPQSRLYGDVYFSSADGLAETRAVFLDGCGLPGAWAGRDHFTVGELGFGTGLNIAALLDLWRRDKPTGGRLHVFSIEAHPITRDEAARALAVWPELGEAAQVLLDHWPSAARGFHRIDLPGFDATLDLAVMDVAQALEAWSGRADAWFLDGFSPALNPAMWSEEILAAVAARTAPGGRAATFTVAGAVRRGLAAAGFAWEKRPGFGRKRERLEATFPGDIAPSVRPKTLAVVGGGIAAASLARAARSEGLAVTVFDANEAKASGNPAALVTPALDAGGGPRAALPAQALARAAALYDALPGAVLARGVLRLATGPRDPDRFAAVAGQDLFAAGEMSVLGADEADAAMGEPAAGALRMDLARVVDPAAVLAAWRGDAVATEVSRLDKTDDGWRLFGTDGSLLATADAVALAGGADLARLWPQAPIRPVRGQTSWTGPMDLPVTPAAFGGYAVPTPDGGVLFGATHDRGETASDLRDADHDRNRAALAKGRPALAASLAGAALDGRAAVRATTADHLPLAGMVPGAPAGLYVLGGLGGRGFATAPLLAEHVVALMLDAPSPLPCDLAALVDPGRAP